MKNTNKTAPLFLYKYMWINPRVLKTDPYYYEQIFTKNLLYLPTIGELNDPFDSIPVLSTEGCDKNELIEIICKANLRLGRPEEFVLEDKKKFESGEIDVFDFFNSNRNRVKENLRRHRVLCFSESPDNPLMWAHYAMNYSGFCLEFQFDPEMFHKKIIPITYSPERPSFKANEFADSKDDYLVSLFTKSDLWAYEKEWRAFVHLDFLAGNTKWRFKREYLKAVILGNNMHPKDKSHLQIWVQLCSGQVQLKKIEFDDNSYLLNIHNQRNR